MGPVVAVLEPSRRRSPLARAGPWRTVLALLVVATVLPAGTEDTSSRLLAIAERNAVQIRAANLAELRATDPDVRRFAGLLRHSGSRLGEDLQQVAGRNNLMLSVELDAADVAILQRLAGLSGADFDRAYLRWIVETRVDEATLRAASRGADADVRALASRMLTVARAQVRRARRLLAAIRSSEPPAKPS